MEAAEPRAQRATRAPSVAHSPLWPVGLLSEVGVHGIGGLVHL